MKDIECPYCEYEFEYCGDSLGEGDETEIECPECEKYFVIMASYSVSYTATKADCLNGEKHKYKESCRYPKVIFGKISWYCTEGCGGTIEVPEGVKP